MAPLRTYIVRADEQWDMGTPNFFYSRIQAISPKHAAQKWCDQNEEEAPISKITEVNGTLVFDVEDLWVLEVTQIK